MPDRHRRTWWRHTLEKRIEHCKVDLASVEAELSRVRGQVTDAASGYESLTRAIQEARVELEETRAALEAERISREQLSVELDQARRQIRVTCNRLFGVGSEPLVAELLESRGSKSAGGWED